MYLVCVCWADMQRTKTPTRNTHTRIETDIPRPKLHELQFRLAFRDMGGLSRGAFRGVGAYQGESKTKGGLVVGGTNGKMETHTDTGAGVAPGGGGFVLGVPYTHTQAHMDFGQAQRPGMPPFYCVLHTTLRIFHQLCPPHLLHQPPLHIRAAGAPPREV